MLFYDVLYELLSYIALSSAGFWSALGGKKEYQTSSTLRNMVKPPRLFGCSNKTGRLMVMRVTETHKQAGGQLRFVNMVMSWIKCLVLLLRLRKFLETSLSQTWLPMMSCCLTPGIRWVCSPHEYSSDQWFSTGGSQKTSNGASWWLISFPDLTCALIFIYYL